jgi:hypothetical protein
MFVICVVQIKTLTHTLIHNAYRHFTLQSSFHCSVLKDFKVRPVLFVYMDFVFSLKM